MLRRTILTGLLTSAVALAAGQSYAQSIKDLEDGTPVTVTGQVTQIQNDKFYIDYGQNRRIEVDLEEWGDQRTNVLIRPGSQVTVSGRIDNDFLQPPEIDADSIYVHDSNRHYTLAAAQQPDTDRVMYREERMTRTETVPAGPRTVVTDQTGVTLNQFDLPASRQVTGRVTGIHGRKLLMMSKDGIVSVDTASLPRDPAGGNVFPMIDEGDVVTFLGEPSERGATLDATRVVTIEKPNAPAIEVQVITPNKNNETTYQ